MSAPVGVCLSADGRRITADSGFEIDELSKTRDPLLVIDKTWTF